VACLILPNQETRKEVVDALDVHDRFDDLVDEFKHRWPSI